MSESAGKRLITVAIVWLIIALILGAVYRFGVAPYFASNEARTAALAEFEEVSQRARDKGITPPTIAEDADADAIAVITRELERRLTGSRATDKPLQHRVQLALDSFSGYSIFRSPEFLDALANQGIGLEPVDDGADYAARLSSIANGQTPLAVFTIDALLKVSAELGDTPATIVMVIDETVGADAIVAYKSAVPNIEALDRSNARFVLTPDSPSEALARVLMANFALPDLPDKPFVAVDGSEAVYNRMRDADVDEPHAYVLWEPYVSKALELPDAHIVLDSSRFRGYIVDVLVVQRSYLLDNEDVVQAVIETYLRESHRVRARANGLTSLVRDDAARAGEAITADQASRIVEGVWWKSTQENYAHFGLRDDAGGIQPLDRIIGNIVTVLERTAASRKTRPTARRARSTTTASTERCSATGSIRPRSDRATTEIPSAKCSKPSRCPTRTGRNLSPSARSMWTTWCSHAAHRA